MQNGASAAQVEADFANCAEAASYNSRLEATITMTYQQELGRNPEPAGLAYYVAALRNGYTESAMRQEIHDSPEAQTYRNSRATPTPYKPTEDGVAAEDIRIGLYMKSTGAVKANTFVQQLYHYYLGRDPDQSELSHWVDRLRSGGAPQDVENDIKYSGEAAAHTNNLTRTIHDIYELEIGRHANATEIDYWVGSMRAGMTRDDVDGIVGYTEEALVWQYRNYEIYSEDFETQGGLKQLYYLREMGQQFGRPLGFAGDFSWADYPVGHGYFGSTYSAPGDPEPEFPDWDRPVGSYPINDAFLVRDASGAIVNDQRYTWTPAGATAPSGSGIGGLIQNTVSSAIAGMKAALGIDPRAIYNVDRDDRANFSSAIANAAGQIADAAAQVRASGGPNAPSQVIITAERPLTSAPGEYYVTTKVYLGTDQFNKPIFGQAQDGSLVPMHTVVATVHKIDTHLKAIANAIKNASSGAEIDKAILSHPDVARALSNLADRKDLNISTRLQGVLQAVNGVLLALASSGLIVGGAAGAVPTGGTSLLLTAAGWAGFTMGVDQATAGLTTALSGHETLSHLASLVKSTLQISDQAADQIAAALTLTPMAAEAFVAHKVAQAVANSERLAGQINNFYRDGASDAIYGATEARLQQLYNDAALNSTHNAGSSTVILGKYIKGSAESYDAVAKARNATYFSMSDWASVESQLGPDRMWNINKTFLEQQIAKGKSFLFTADPTASTAGYFTKLEYDYLVKNGYRIQPTTGGFFNAVK